MVQIQPPRPNVQATFGWLFCYHAPSPREQVLALEYDKGQRIFEDELIQDSSIDDIDHDVLDRYKSLLGTESSDEQVLKSRRFMRDGKLTVAGALLFAQDPSVMMPQARVRVLRYDGVKMETGKRLNITKERTFCGPLPKVIQDAHPLISSMLREFQFLGPDGTFQTVPEYPEFAWFEGLVNAETHRDCSFRGDYIRISMFDDRLEITSPGKLPNIVTLDNMRTTRYSRNPRIARTLIEFGWVRELNEGVQRIYGEMQRMLLHDPTFDHGASQHLSRAKPYAPISLNTKRRARDNLLPAIRKMHL